LLLCKSGQRAGGVFDGLIEKVESAQEVGLIKMPTGQRDNHLFDLNRNHVALGEFRHIEHCADDALG